MFSDFLSKFSSPVHARIVLECLEVLAKNLALPLFKDAVAKDQMIDSAIHYLQDLKEKPNE